MENETKVVPLADNDWRLDKAHDEIVKILMELPEDLNSLTVLGLIEAIKQEVIMNLVEFEDD